ncbi:MAG: hypothetical protein C0467_21635 [Planctomycetaceae bacterium]|nr:hypothetical protein [Planctomycetaceae bacterium]
MAQALPVDTMHPAASFCPNAIHLSRRQDPKYRAEVEFFDSLVRQMPEGWHVFYHVGWLNRDSYGALRDGESDFILAHPVHGVLVIELKGGFITLLGQQQQWISTDRHGIDHDIKNPFGQAKDSKHTLIGKLREQPDLANTWVGMHHGVAFPDCPRQEGSIHPEADHNLIIWQEDMQRLPARVVEILRHSYGADTFRNGHEIVAALHRLLCRTVTLANPLRTQIDAEAREIQSLTDSQIDAFAKFQRIRRVAVGGGAGAGKTYVAVHRARQLASEGFRTLFTCHSKRLATFLKSLLRATPNLEVYAAEDLARQYCPALPQDATEAALAEGLFDAATALTARPYHAIFVDEGQDFTSEWWPAFEALLIESRKSVFFVCHDTNNQVVRPGAGSLPEDLAPIDLDENVRNTTDICAALKPYYHGQVGIRPRMSVGRAVEHHLYAEGTFSQVIGRVLSRLLVTEGLLAKDIVVLTPRAAEDSALPALALPAGIRLTADESAVKRRTVLWANVADFKGLERTVALVAELDDRLPTDPKGRDAVLYVAFSRPRSLLAVFHTEAARDWVGGKR